MIIGVPRETKTLERRVALDPAAVRLITDAGHTVLFETEAGRGAGFDDADYVSAGAETVSSPSEAWGSDLVVKVKEPQPAEYDYFRSGLRLFCYLHLAAEPELAASLMEAGVDAHAFETVVEDGQLPLLAPMSEVAGRAAVIFGAAYLADGSGTLLSGAPGVPPAHVVVVGLGVAGRAAAKSAIGQDSVVTAIDVNLPRLGEAQSQGFVSSTLSSNTTHIGEAVQRADLVIGAALVPGARAPRILHRDHFDSMRPGSVFVDLAIDQGGCAETSRPTNLADPVFEEHGVIHYCVTNVPGQYPRTATKALSAALAPRVLALAADRASLPGSSNVAEGGISHPEVRRALANQLATVA